MSGDVIKEFLVALGFRIDDAGLKKFDKAVDKATKATVKLGAAVVATAAAVEYATTKIAQQMSTLYFSTKRIGDTAGNIRAFEFAMGQLGSTAEAARSSLEGVGSFLRNIPAAEQFIRGLGVETRDANGNLRQTTALLRDLGPIFAAMPAYQAKAYAGVLGIDERTLLAMKDGTFNARMDDYARIVKRIGVNQEASAGANRDYNNEMIRFEAHASALALFFETKFLPVATDLLQWGEQMAVAIADLSRWFSYADEKTGGLFGAFGELATGALKIIAIMLLLVNALALVRKALILLSAAGLLNPVTLAIIAIGAAALVIIKHWDTVKSWFAGFFGWFERKWKAFVGVYNTFAKSVGLPTIGTEPAAGAPIVINQGAISTTPSGAKNAGASPQATKKAMEFFERMGWSSAQAAGIVANLIRESGLNPSSVGDQGRAVGIAQWHADRQAEFAKWAGHDIRKSTFEEQLAFVNYELTKGAEMMAGARLKGAKNARESGSLVSQLYERPGNMMGEAIIRGSAADQLAQNRGVTISQKTDITVNGAGNPRETANAVESKQQWVNASLVRNTEGAIR